MKICLYSDGSILLRTIYNMHKININNTLSCTKTVTKQSSGNFKTKTLYPKS